MKLKEICQNTIEYKLIENFEIIKNDNINEKIRNNNNYKRDLKRFLIAFFKLHDAEKIH